MADPLSIAAGVVGLLTAAVQVSDILGSVIRKARHAPEECKRIKAEVDDIRNVLGQLQLFILRINSASRSRTSLLMVDQVVATLSSCVLTFSDLQVFVEGLKSDADIGILDRLRWKSKDTEISTILGKLETHKTSLTLMLTILTCQLQLEAESKVDRLCNLIEEQILAKNPMLAGRLASFDAGGDDSRTITTQRTGAAVNKLSLVTGPEDEPDPMAELADHIAGVKRDVRGFAFEELLMNSRAYRMAAHNNSDAFSVTSSAGRTASWSMLSGLSLSEMSNIAILALPVYATDISNKEVYDFEPPRDEGKLNVPLNPSRRSAAEGSERRSLSKWWKKFDASNRLQSNRQEAVEDTPAVFGQPLDSSVRYANIAISLMNEEGESFIYGYVPVVIGKVGVFLKEKATDVKDIFATSGSSVRMLQLQKIFDKPDRYGKGHDWTGYTVHDAAGLTLRYLKSLPEPVIPYGSYASFTAPFAQFKQEDDVTSKVEVSEAVGKLQRCVVELPPLSRQLLLYLLDLLAVFASKSDLNNMTAARLVAVFQPALLSKPPSEMDAEEHHMAAQIMVFMIDSQDNFLIGMAPKTEATDPEVTPSTHPAPG